MNTINVQQGEAIEGLTRRDTSCAPVEGRKQRPLLSAAWKPLAATLLLFVLFFETRALVRITIVDATPLAVLRKAEAGLVTDARIVNDVLYVHPEVETHSIGASVRGALGLPAAGRLLAVRTRDSEVATLVAQLEGMGLSVRHADAQAH